MVSTRLISKSSCSFAKPLGIVPSSPITIGITVSSIFHSIFVFGEDLNIYLSFHLFLIWLCGLLGQQNPLFGTLFLFCWLWLGLSVRLRLDVKFVSQNPKECCASHSLDGFWIQRIPLVRMVKFILLAQFPVNQLLYSVASSLILSGGLLVTFAHYVIDHFVSIIT